MPKSFGGLGTVVTGLLQGLLDDAAFHLVEVILYLHGARIKRRNGAVIERGFARVRFGDVIKRKATAIGFGLRGVLNLQVVHLYHLADRQCNGAFEDILQLAEVAGIAVMQQGFLGFRAEFCRFDCRDGVCTANTESARPSLRAFRVRRHVQGDKH